MYVPTLDGNTFVAHCVILSNHSGINVLVGNKYDTDRSSFTILYKFKRHQGGGTGKLHEGGRM